MKVSLNTLQSLDTGAHTDSSPQDTLIARIGAQLGGIDDTIDIGDRYIGCLIVDVVRVTPHPNADRLRLCHIDDGGVASAVARNEDGYVAVVCGAPNVTEGMKAVWLPPGTTVPETVGKNPFVLEARELRGIVSNGMLASPKELALGDSHEGILALDGTYAPGANFAETFNLSGDTLLDIENKMFTHRPDCFGWLGIARELAGISGRQFTSPDWYRADPELPAHSETSLPLSVINEVPELVPRFTAVSMKDVAIGPSPVWLQIELAKVGLRSINNIVDLTNYYMVLTGQPLHAYDYDKVRALSGGNEARIIIRKPQTNETVTLLNGKQITPRPDAIMIATDSQLIGIGGVMGGADTEVSSSTKNIILESANFDMYSVRRTSMAHGLFTDAVTRFNKGQSPLQTLPVLLKIANDVKEYGNGQLASDIIDNNHVASEIHANASLYPAIVITPAFVNDRLGLTLSAAQMEQLLVNVEFAVSYEDEKLTVRAPFWRTDIELREDLVEEIGRLYGYDNVPLELPKRPIEPTARNIQLDNKMALRKRLTTAGANEVLTYSFVSGKLLRNVCQDATKAYAIANALSPDLQYYRLSLMPSLLEKVHPNVKAGYTKFALYEIGKTHTIDSTSDGGLPEEYEATAVVITQADKAQPIGSAFYAARKYLDHLTRGAAVYTPLTDDETSEQSVQPYNVQRSARVTTKDGTILGILGEFRNEVSTALKLPRYTAGFEISTDGVGAILRSGTAYTPLPRFPQLFQDISIKVAAATPFKEVFDEVNAAISILTPQHSHMQLSPIDIYLNEHGQKHVTLRLQIANYDRTLTDAEVSGLFEAAMREISQARGWERV